MAGERYFLPQRTPRDIVEAWVYVLELVRQLNGRSRQGGGNPTILATIGTSETTVKHGGATVPRKATARPRAAVAVGQTKQPDSTNVYFTAASSVLCDIDVEF